MNSSRLVVGLLGVTAILSLILLGRIQTGEEQAYAYVDDSQAITSDFATGQVTTATAYLPLLRRDAAYLPDLVVGDVFNSWCPDQDNQCSCVPADRELTLMACVENQGPALAGAFYVTINTTMLRVASLAGGQSLCIADGPEAFAADVYVDAQDDVHESREDNNAFAGPIPVPTPLPTCTPG